MPPATGYAGCMKSAQLPSTRKQPPVTVRGVALQMAIFWLVYTLSIGPMFWTWYGAVFVGGSRWIVAFYAPLQYACEIVPYYGNWVDAYIWWWNCPSPHDLSDQAQQLLAG